MKKNFLLSMSLLAILLLSACSPNVYKESMQNGAKALEAEDYETAIGLFEKALKEDPESLEARNEVNKSKDMYFTALIEKGTIAKQEGKIKVANDSFKKAMEMNDAKEAELPSWVAETDALLKKQSNLDAYSKWLNEASKYNYELLKEWRTISDGLSIGTIQRPEFVKRLKAMLSTSNELLATSEEELLNLSGELAEAHRTYINGIQANHEAMHSTILRSQDKNIENQVLLTTGKEISSIQVKQATHIQALKSYAQVTGIVFSEK